MPRAAKLKVFRTAIGFHDAYVAAPSRKAALQAWGSDKDLFARGAAELVTDEALTTAPLAAPGTVVKRLRGTVAEQIAALPPDKPAPAPDRRPGRADGARSARRPEPTPRPSRAALEQAERAVAAAEEQQADALAALRQREEALARERRALEAQGDATLRALAKVRDGAAAAYDRALAAWRGDGD